MLSKIEESYTLFLKKLPLWIALVLPVTAFSFVDEYVALPEYSWEMTILGIILLSLTELFIFKYAGAIQLGYVGQIIKKTIVYGFYQAVIGAIMMVPVYIAMQIAQHHQMLTFGYVLICFVANIFLGGWFFAKANAILPLIAAGEKISFSKFKEYVKGSYFHWCLVSLLIYFPYVYSVYLINCLITSMILSNLFMVVFCLFNVKYYQAKQ